MRAELAPLVARLRARIGDAAGSDPALSDDDLAAVLERVRLGAGLVDLTPVPALQAGGAYEYREYVSPDAYDASASLWDGATQPVAVSEADPASGRWVLAASVAPPVRVWGTPYDLDRAVVDALELWATRLATVYDVSLDGQALSRSQMAAGLRAAAAEARRQLRPRVAAQVRSDLP